MHVVDIQNMPSVEIDIAKDDVTKRSGVSVKNHRNRGSKLKIFYDERIQEEHEEEESGAGGVQNGIDPNIRRIAEFNVKNRSQSVEDLRNDIINDSPDVMKQEQSNTIKKNLSLVVLSIFVIISATVATVFQSVLLSSSHYQFPFPLFSAAFSNSIQFFVSILILGIFGKIGKLCGAMWSVDGILAFKQAILPYSLVSAAELAISFVSLQMVTLSYFTMVKSSAVIFVLIGGFITGQEQINLTLFSVIVLTGSGVILAVYDSKSSVGVEIIGFGLVLLAAILNAVKWVIVDMLLKGNRSYKNILDKFNASSSSSGSTAETEVESKHNFTPLLSVLLLSPITFLSLFIITAIFEGFPGRISEFLSFESWNYFGVAMGGLLFTSILVFYMRVIDYRLVQDVSLITFALLGIIREVIMILVSVFFLGEILQPINVVGLVVTIAGICLYYLYRYRETLQNEAIKKGNLEIELQPVQKKTNRVNAYSLMSK